MNANLEEDRTQVELLVGRAGDGFSQMPGQIINVCRREAERMLAKGQCKPVAGVIETHSEVGFETSVPVKKKVNRGSQVQRKHN